MYPNEEFLYPGSHWKRLSSDPHFIDVSNINSVTTYKSMMIDDPNSNIGVGFCEFEAVITTPPEDGILIEKIKNELGNTFRKDKDLLYMDLKNSFQSTYIGDKYYDDSKLPIFDFTIVIPFSPNVDFTNEIDIELMPNEGGYMPKIDWNKSKIYSDSKGSDIAYSILETNSDLPNNGKYRCVISDYVVPSRAELVVRYDDLIWKRIPFMVSHYVYTDHRQFNLPSFFTSGDQIKFVFEKTYDVFVDSEANSENEKRRALKVLSGDIRS